MRAGISTATFFLKNYTEEALAQFAEWGVACTEVFYATHSEYRPAFSQELLKVKGNVDVHSIHVLGTQFEPQLYGAHARSRADSYETLKNVMRSAQSLGAKYYTFHGLPRMKRTFREDFEKVGRGTAEIFDFCAEYGVKLCYENVEWAFYNRPGVFRELKARCPSLCGVLDIKQARLSGHDYAEYLEEMGGSIAHVHVSDLDENGKMRLPGRGKFDFETLVKRLVDVGFDGPLIVENYVADYGDASEVFSSYCYLCELIDRFR